MRNLIVRNLITSLIFIFVPVISASAIIALISLFSLIVRGFAALIYIISGLIGLLTCLLLRKLCFSVKPCYYPEDVETKGDANKKDKYWIERIKGGKYIKRRETQAIYIPYFILGLVAIVFIVLFHTVFGVQTLSFEIYATICAALSALTVSLFLYGIFGLRSLNICKKCGAVNAFMYEADLEFNLVSHYRGQEAPYSSGVNAYGIRYRGGGGCRFDSRKVKKYGNRIERRCACCGEKSVYIPKWEMSRIFYNKRS